MRTCIHYIHIEWPLREVWKDSLNVRKTLNKAAASFVLKTWAQEVALLYFVALVRLKQERKERKDIDKKARPVLPASTWLLSITPWKLKFVKSDFVKNEWNVAVDNSAFSRQRDVKARALYMSFMSEWGPQKTRLDFNWDEHTDTYWP